MLCNAVWKGDCFHHSDCMLSSFRIYCRLSAVFLCLIACCESVADNIVTVTDSDSLVGADSVASPVAESGRLHHLAGIGVQPLFGSGERVLVGASYYYLAKPWFGVGGSLGIMYNKYGACEGDTVRVTKPYIEPSVVFGLPHSWRISDFIGVVPVIQVGLPFVPSYRVRGETSDGLREYSTDSFALNLRAGFIVGIGGIPLQLGYMFSTIDNNRVWDEKHDRWKKRVSHGLFVGLTFGF